MVPEAVTGLISLKLSRRILSFGTQKTPAPLKIAGHHNFPSSTCVSIRTVHSDEQNHTLYQLYLTFQECTAWPNDVETFGH